MLSVHSDHDVLRGGGAGAVGYTPSDERVGCAVIHGASFTSTVDAPFGDYRCSA